MEFVRKEIPRINLGAFYGAEDCAMCFFHRTGWKMNGPDDQLNVFLLANIGCILLQKQFGLKGVIKGVTHRFDKYPVHRKCYHASTTSADELRRECLSHAYNCREYLVDQFGFTPFHVLLSSASCTADLLQVLLDAYPPTILGWQDIREKRAMDYLNYKLWTSEVKILMHMCLLAFMVDRVGRWGSKEQLEAISLKVSVLVEQADVDKRATLMEEACKLLCQCQRKGRVFQLELALWKSSMITCGVLVDGGASDRLESRVVSGASVVIPSVVAFLPETGSDNAQQNDAEEDPDDSIASVPPGILAMDISDISDSDSESESDREDDESWESDDSIAALPYNGGVLPLNFNVGQSD
eukprot:CAMPEP_0113656392 /NCGR_PEP_ID=MMETSP0017_2-20120614/30326_1 /TAXON_ID=2856 /ORGANISM="Cylindrotheca closterium" /LENGTH=353 /DNA_ID=CAMNT_0000569925 /DNA_START=101 /DNA_END=1163 /DNA_ORIENTATION=+ /assembly_acc=CAM_ASM_000147